MAKGRKNYNLTINIGGKIDKSLSNSVNGVLKTVGKLGIGMKAAQAAWNATKWIGKQTVEFAKESIESAKTYESAMANVAKVVDGLTDEAGNHTAAYKEMYDQILKLSTQIPMTAEEIAQIVEAAGQSNIEPDQLLRFAEAAAKMGVAFDTSAEQAGQWMAVWRTSMNLTQDEVETLADQVNYLGNTSSEQAVKIAQVVSDVGALGASANVTAGDLAALAAATTGVEASAAGTGIKNVITALSKGTAATKKQKTAFEKLGLSAENVAMQMQDNAQETILTVLDAINQMPDYQQMGIVNDMFGKTSLQTVSKLTHNVENLREQFEKINSINLFGGSMDQEFSIKSKTYENQLTLLKNTLDKFKIEVGTGILESLNEVLPEITPKISKALDDALPKIKESFKKIDFDKVSDTVDRMIPIAEKFIVETLPLLPDTIQSAIDLVNTLSPLVEKVCDTISLMLSLLAGTANGISNLFKRSSPSYDPSQGWNEKTFPEYSGPTSKDVFVGPAMPSKTVSTTLPGKNSAEGKAISESFATKFATGGIVTKPTFAMIGEGGEKEAVIPLSKLNAMLSGKLQSNAMTITYSPVINIENGNRDEVEAVMQDEYGKFKKFMNQYAHERTRLKF